MSIQIKLPIPKQSLTVYQLLLKERTLSAQDIASKLNIFPNAVYRAAQTLIELELIEKTNTYPVEFQAKSINEALENYLVVSKNSFLENFSHVDKRGQNSSNHSQKLSVSFIKTRSELLEMTNSDMKTVQKTIDHIVSGLELPAEIMLSYKKAHDRGIQLRFLVQNLNELNRDLLASWQKMGLIVRYFPLLEARIIIFDSKILYLTSYNPKNKEEAIGVRFAYAPIAQQISDLFEKRWEVSEPII